MRAIVAALLLAPAAALAEGPACHCFTDRTYDPARPASADAYILASTRSSLLSATHGVVKRALVQAVMGGADPDDLFVAHWVAARAGASAEDLLEARRAHGSWKAAVPAPARARLPAAFQARLDRGAGAAALAAVAVDDVLVSRAGASARQVAAIRELGAANGEVILATVLARETRSTPAEVLAQVRSGERSWGWTLHAAGLAPADMDRVVRAQVEAARGTGDAAR